MIYAETERLRLRALTKADLPRVTGFLNEWDVTRWLTRVPFPYAPADAAWWLDRVTATYNRNEPEFFAMAGKDDNLLVGGIGLHPSTAPNPKPDERELGYWLAKPYWGKGYMSEAALAVIKLGFAREALKKITVFTDPGNAASQNVLRKSGFRYLGMGPRVEQGCLRGSTTATRWEMTRKDYEGRV